MIGIFVLLLSSKDDLISLAGVGQRTIFIQNSFCPTPFFLYNSNFFSTLFLSKTLSLKKRKKSAQIPCIGAFIVLNYYGAVKKQLLALMQEVATRSVALPRNARRFSCGASLLS